MTYSPEDFADVKASLRPEAADIDLDFGPHGIEAEIAFRKALDNGLPDKGTALLNSQGADLYDSASEADFACMGYLCRARLTANENAVVILAHPRGDDIKQRHPNVKDYFARSLSKIYSNGAHSNGHRPVTPSGLTLADVDTVFGKWLLLRDSRAQHGVLAAVAAHRAGGESVWAFVVDAPGSGKTETIRSLNGMENVFPLSSLTPATFVSGQKVSDHGKDPSLLLRLPAECIVTLKDFTTCLSMHRDSRQEILAQLRELADGSYVKEFGNGKTVKWEGRMSFIAGVTPALDSHWAVNQTLGERFIQIRPQAPDPLEVADRVMENVGREDEMRAEIQDAVTDFLTGLDYPPINAVVLSPDMWARLKHLATFACRARSAVERDGYAREISYIPVPEGPARLAKQLSTLARGRAIIDGTTTLSDASFGEVVEIGMDCIPPHRRAVLDALISGGELQTSDITDATRYPVNTARRILEELMAVGMVERRTVNNLYCWRLSEQAEKWRIHI